MANTWMDDAENEYEERLMRSASACRCGGDMPGRCLGPANCPMCQDDPSDDNN